MRLCEFIDMDYQEEEGSTFSSNGKEYDLNILFKLSKYLPIEMFEIDDLKWVLKYDPADDDERVEKSDFMIPILVTKISSEDSDEKLLLVVDGVHRLKKAINYELKYIPGKLLSNKIMKQALL